MVARLRKLTRQLLERLQPIAVSTASFSAISSMESGAWPGCCEPEACSCVVREW
jgi:hypothetical protein